jgi:hypothetical protein
MNQGIYDLDLRHERDHGGDVNHLDDEHCLKGHLVV